MAEKEDEERLKRDNEEAEQRRRKREERERLTPKDKPDEGTGDGGAHLKDRSTEPGKKPGI